MRFRQREQRSNRSSAERLCAAFLIAIASFACERESLPTKPPGEFTTLNETDLRDGLWEIAPDAKSAGAASAWPRYVAVVCERFQGSAEADMVRASAPYALLVPCGCIDRPLIATAQLGGVLAAVRCTRSSQLIVLRWGFGTRLIIRKRRDSRLAGEMRSGDGEGQLLGRFVLRPIDLNARESPHARGTLRVIAGAGAIDCGRATDRRSADRVYDCAAAALAQHRPFFCRYSQPLSVAVDSAPFSTCAYVGMADGRVFAVDEVPGEPARLAAQVLGRSSPDPWRTLRPGMKPPAVVSRPDDARRVDGRVNGIIIIETLIGPDGSVRDARILKPLPYGIDEAARQMVLASKFAPSRFFGVPVTIVYNVTLRALNGSLDFTQRDR